MINNIIIASGGNFGPGNSGGPAYICENGEMLCIGIVSALAGSSNPILTPIGMVRGVK